MSFRYEGLFANSLGGPPARCFRITKAEAEWDAIQWCRENMDEHHYRWRRCLDADGGTQFFILRDEDAITFRLVWE
jgi:hypothetical protein